MTHQLQREAWSHADTAHPSHPRTPNVPTLPHRQLPTWRHSGSTPTGGGEKRLREPRRRRGLGHCSANDWGGQPHHPWAGGGRRGGRGAARVGAERKALRAPPRRAAPQRWESARPAAAAAGPRRCAPPGRAPPRPPTPARPPSAPRDGSAERFVVLPTARVPLASRSGAAPTGGTAAACHQQRRPGIPLCHRARSLHPPPPRSGLSSLLPVTCVAFPIPGPPSPLRGAPAPIQPSSSPPPLRLPAWPSPDLPIPARSPPLRPRAPARHGRCRPARPQRLAAARCEPPAAPAGRPPAGRPPAGRGRWPAPPRAVAAPTGQPDRPVGGGGACGGSGAWLLSPLPAAPWVVLVAPAAAAAAAVIVDADTDGAAAAAADAAATGAAVAAAAAAAAATTAAPAARKQVPITCNVGRRRWPRRGGRAWQPPVGVV